VEEWRQDGDECADYHFRLCGRGAAKCDALAEERLANGATMSGEGNIKQKRTPSARTVSFFDYKLSDG
jgi:hypothetical protein